MEEKSINFIIKHKTKSIPLHQVLNGEGLIILDYLMVKNLKGVLPSEFCLQSAKDSPTAIIPMLFTLLIPKPFHENLGATSDSFAVCFFEKMSIDCKRIKLEMTIVNLEQIQEGTIHYAELHYKTLDGDGNNATTVYPKIKMENKLIRK
jgi:hypothetical protein